jgi:ABC-type multidrug transport system ATPase subunit
MTYVNKIIAEKISKKFNDKYIIRDFSYDFTESNHYAILGPNGSGKSTLAQLISGIRALSSGSLKFYVDNKLIEEKDVYKYISFSAPYQELPEDLTLNEIVSFHKSLKGFINDFSVEDFIQYVNLNKHKNKQIKNFSSGMQQRLKLALAILSDSKFVFLDEPTSNLDAANTDWYLETVKKHINKRIFIVCSNHNNIEYQFCNKSINVLDFK